jgi:MFS family permease
MALIGAAFGIGFTFGPLIAFFGESIFRQNPGGPGYLAAALSLAALLFGLARLPETRRPGVPGAHRGWLDVGRLLRTLNTPTVGLLVLTFFLATLAFAMFESTLSVLTKDVFGYGREENYLIFAYVGFVLMIAQGGVYRPMAKRVREETFVGLGVGLMLLGLAGGAAVTYFAKEEPKGWTVELMAALAVAVFGFAFLTPSAQSLISRRSDPNRQGEVLGVNQSFAALARILGPLAGLTLFGLEDRHMLPFVAASVLLLGVLTLVPRVRKS